jgi:hypothetical protein
MSDPVLLWASPPMYYPAGGGSEWRLIVYRHGWSQSPVTAYEWHRTNETGWQAHKQWPTYDFNNGSTLGLPPVTRELWKVWQHQARAIIKGDEFGGPATEPTEAGLQYVIPGCEKDRTRGPIQMTLF